jgi:hypothetical protein
MEHRQQLSGPASATALKSARAILRTLRAARRAGKVPQTIVLSLELHEHLQSPAVSYLWDSPKRDVLFGLPIEVDAGTEGWKVRVS